MQMQTNRNLKHEESKKSGGEIIRDGQAEIEQAKTARRFNIGHLFEAGMDSKNSPLKLGFVSIPIFALPMGFLAAGLLVVSNLLAVPVFEFLGWSAFYKVGGKVVEIWTHQVYVNLNLLTLMGPVILSLVLMTIFSMTGLLKKRYTLIVFLLFFATAVQAVEMPWKAFYNGAGGEYYLKGTVHLLEANIIRPPAPNLLAIVVVAFAISLLVSAATWLMLKVLGKVASNL